MTESRRYADRKRRGVCTECGRRPACPRTVRCARCARANGDRMGGRVPTASATYWRHREERWRHRHIMVEGTDGVLRDFAASDYITAWRKQGGLCGLCEKPLPVQKWHNGVGTGQGISVDHDHHTRLFRALLDTGCNIRVSTLSLAWAVKVVAYLRQHEVRIA